MKVRQNRIMMYDVVDDKDFIILGIERVVRIFETRMKAERFAGIPHFEPNYD